MVQKDLLPALYTYSRQLSETILSKRSVSDSLSTASEEALLTQLSLCGDALSQTLGALQADLASASDTSEPLKAAKFYETAVLKDLEEIRGYADQAEALIPDQLLPYPTYDRLLFGV